MQAFEKNDSPKAILELSGGQLFAGVIKRGERQCYTFVFRKPNKGDYFMKAMTEEQKANWIAAIKHNL